MGQMKALFMELTIDSSYQEELEIQDLTNVNLEPDLPDSQWVKGMDQSHHPLFAFDEDVPF